jgi:hypothetical protein
MVGFTEITDLTRRSGIFSREAVQCGRDGLNSLARHEERRSI